MSEPKIDVSAKHSSCTSALGAYRTTIERLHPSHAAYLARQLQHLQSRLLYDAIDLPISREDREALTHLQDMVELLSLIATNPHSYTHYQYLCHNY